MGIFSRLGEAGARAARAVSRGRSSGRSSGAVNIAERLAGQIPRYGGGGAGGRTRATAAKLRAKAASTTFPREAATFRAKAASMESKAQRASIPRGTGGARPRSGRPPRPIPQRDLIPHGRGTGLPWSGGAAPAPTRAQMPSFPPASRAGLNRKRLNAAKDWAPPNPKKRQGRGTGFAVGSNGQAERVKMQRQRGPVRKAMGKVPRKAAYAGGAALGVGVVYNAGRRSSGPGASRQPSSTGVYGY